MTFGVFRTALLAMCLAPIPVAAANVKPATEAVADTEITLLLDPIENALTTDDAASCSARAAKLVAKQKLLPSACDQDCRVMQDFPESLRSYTKQMSEGKLSINLNAFANAAGQYIDPSKNVPIDVAKTQAEPPPQAATKAKPPPVPTKSEPQAEPQPKPEKLPLPIQRTLLDRGDEMLRRNDITAARLLYARAAENDVAIAAFKLGNTYDPAFLAEHNVRGSVPNVKEAMFWYERAKELGATEAGERLKMLEQRRVAEPSNK